MAALRLSVVAGAGQPERHWHTREESANRDSIAELALGQGECQCHLGTVVFRHRDLPAESVSYYIAAVRYARLWSLCPPARAIAAAPNGDAVTS